MPCIEFTVIGKPAPKGSKRFVGIKGGRGILVESSKYERPWAEAVKYAALEFVRDHTVLGISPRCVGAVELEVIFVLKRPKSAKRGAVPDKKPDLSKLVRSTEDAISDAGLWEDDARVVKTTSSKVYEGDLEHSDLRDLNVPGAFIRISSRGSRLAPCPGQPGA